MSDKKVQKLVVSALMAALTYVATMVVRSGGICSPAARLFVLLWNIPYTWA